MHNELVLLMSQEIELVVGGEFSFYEWGVATLGGAVSGGVTGLILGGPMGGVAGFVGGAAGGSTTFLISQAFSHH